MTTFHIASSGGTYTSFQTGHDNIPSNPTDDYTLSGESSTAFDSGGVTLSVSNSNARAFLITVISANRFTAPTSAQAAAACRINSTSNPAITVTGSGWTIEYISLISGGGVTLQVTGATVKVRYCLITGGSTYLVRQQTSGTLTMISNAVFDSAGSGVFSYYNEAGTLNAHHETFISRINGLGMYEGGTVTANGCAGDGSGFGDFYSSGPSGNYNCSHDSTAPGANSLINKTGVFVAITTGSANLTLSGSPVVNVVNRSGYPTDTDYDCVGTARPSTGADCGCWQTPVVAAVKQRLFFLRQAVNRASTY